MLQRLDCQGAPFDIGYQHGTAAKDKIIRCIAFYANFLKVHCHFSWPDVRTVAQPFAESVQNLWPDLYEEMRGVAEGAEQSILDIVALNVRTEIAFGHFSDGCTSLAWHTGGHAFLGQNWDWEGKQKENLILLKITQPHKPTIQMVTEAGIIGKIGFNSAGVGVCLNALRAKGADSTRMPVHLALRLVLQSSSAQEAVQALEKWGVASSAHLLIADQEEAFGLETSSSTLQAITKDDHGRVIHSNHFILHHPGVADTQWLEDSPFRLERMRELTDQLGQSPTLDMIMRVFEDEKQHPTSICRQELGKSSIGTLFNIVMDLKERQVVVRMGRPTQVEEKLVLRF